MKGTIDFDAAVATPDLMAAVGRAVRDIKGGKVEYKTDHTGCVHMIIGKKSFTEQQLVENYQTVIDEILRAKPSAAKGKYVKSLTIATTMGPNRHQSDEGDRVRGPARLGVVAPHARSHSTSEVFPNDVPSQCNHGAPAPQRVGRPCLQNASLGL